MQSILQTLQDKGARRILRGRADVANIPANDPRRKAALDVLMEELSDVALLVLDQQSSRAARQSDVDGATQAKLDTEHKETVKAWSKAGTRIPHALMELGIADVYVDCGGGVVELVGAGALGRALKAGKPVAQMKPGFLALCVPETEAAAFVEKFNLPETLTWTSEGHKVFCLSDRSFGKLGLGSYIPSVLGERFWCGASGLCPVRGKGVVYVPIDGKFTVEPKKALQNGAHELPAMPEKLTQLLKAVSSNDARSIDQTLLG